jgi:hypothetical protein
MRPQVVVATLAVVGLGLPVYAEELSATPYRPTLSNPASLSAAGHLEVEMGGLYSHGGDVVRRSSLPWLAKYAFTDRFGILIGGEALISQTDALDRYGGLGDTSVALKVKFPVDDRSAFGLEAGLKAPTAKDSLGSGRTDYTLVGIYSRSIGAVAMDLNVGVFHLGDDNPAEGANQIIWAAAASYDLGRGLGVAGEFSGTSIAGVDSASWFLAAVTYSVSPRWVLDAGGIRNLGGNLSSWSAFAGMTLLLR